MDEVSFRAGHVSRPFRRSMQARSSDVEHSILETFMHVDAPLLRGLRGGGGMVSLIEVTFYTGAGKVGRVCRRTERHRPGSSCNEIAEIMSLCHTQINTEASLSALPVESNGGLRFPQSHQRQC